ncbi:MAG TPA: 16S rRNA (cytidine(1402)-2'-O)-methyltransferase [Patescibacteria group bacterium]
MKLSIVGLPIGNIEDISFRAIQTIQESKYLVCEDTRMFSNLWSKLQSLGYVQKYEGKIRFINDFNEERQLPRVVEEMMLEENAVLVSDAGMPLISDPGYKLVRSAVEAGWEIDVIPGPTAESAALALSGLPTDKYFFVGFLPKKEGKRTDMLKHLLEMSKLQKFTAVIYESPQRTEKILNEIQKLLGESLGCCVAIDITKISEKVYRGTVSSVLNELQGKKIKGEVVIVLGLQQESSDDQI